MAEEQETPEVLHGSTWKDGETVTLKQGGPTWALNRRAEAAALRAATKASGLSASEMKHIVEEQGEEELGNIIEPYIDPVIQQLTVMLGMIASWTLPWPRTLEGLEQLPEEYGKVIQTAIDARAPKEVLKTEVGGFPGAGTGSSEVAPATPGSGDAGNVPRDPGNDDHRENGVDIQSAG